MISKKKIIALASCTIVLLQAGCVSFESDVFAATSAAPTSEEQPAAFAQAYPPPTDDLPTVDFASVSPR
jgi:hypothetical protein